MAEQGGEQEPARRGLADRVAASWRAPRLEMRRLLQARPSEATLLSLLMVVAMLGFVARYVEHAQTSWDPNAPEFVAAWEERERGRIKEAREDIAAAFAAERIGAAERDRLTAALQDPAALPEDARARQLQAAMGEKLARDRFEMLIATFLAVPLFVYLLAALATPALRFAGGAGGGYETRAALVWTAVVTAPVLLAAHLALTIGKPGGALGLGLELARLAFWLFFLATFLAEAHKFRSRAPILGAVLGGLVFIALILYAVG